MASYQAQHIQFENWSPEEVANWLQGLDESVAQYVPLFKLKCVDGRRLLMLNHSDLEKMGIHKLGHQELVLEAVDLLRALRYTLDTENLQSMALQLGCKARNVVAEIHMRQGENDQNRANMRHSECLHRKRLSVTVLSYVADMLATLKNLVSWLDRAPFEGIYDICRLRNSVVKLGLELVMVTQRESAYVDPEEAIMKSCRTLIEYCDGLVQNTKDTLVIQPAALEQATIRKKQGEELGMNIQSAYNGIHGISSIKDLSPADMCSKIEKGDEVLQVNGQTVLGWQLKELVKILKDRPKEVTLLLKKRPRHINPLGAMQNHKKLVVKHVPQPSTLPKSLKKRRSREGDIKQGRPSLQEFVSVASSASDDIYVTKDTPGTNDGDEIDTDNDVFRSGSESPQYTLPVMPDAKQRRATVSGGSPTFERNSLMVEDPVIRTKSQVNKGDREAALAILAASENNLKGRVPEGGVEEGGTKKTDSVWRKTSSESSSGQKGPSESEMEDSVFSSDKEDKEHQKPEKLVAEKKRQEFRVTKPTPMLMEPTSAVMASPQKTPSRKNSSSSSSSVSSSTSTSTIINSPDSVTKVKANSDSKLVPKIPKTKVLEAALKWGDQSGVVFRRKPSAPKSFVPLGRKTAVSCMDPSQSSGTNSKNAKWDCDKKSMSVTYNKQLIESQHSNEKSDVSQDREKKLFLSGESEKVTVVSKQCMEKTDVSQHCEKNTKNGNGFRDCSEQIIEIQDCEKTVTVPLDCEKTVTVPRDSEKTVTVPRDSEKTVTVPGDCEKPVTIPQDCEGKTVLSLNCENRLNGSENCEQTVSAKCCIVKPIPSETEVRKTSVTASSLLPSNTSPLFSKEDSKSPSFMTGALEFPYSTAVTDKDLEETSANIQSYTENSNMEKNNQDSLDHASHCADSPRPVLDLTHSAEQKCAVPAPGAAHSECRPQIPQQQAIHTEVATESTYDKDTPQLLKIVNTNGESEPSKQKKRVEFSSEAKSSAPSEEVSYTHIVVGGIVQKIPTERVQASGRVSPPVKMRQKNIRKHLDRRVSCKDLGKGDCEGWLYKRKEKDRSLSKNWSKRWCVLKNYNMYCYKHKEDLKAEGVIYLPAFLVSPAPSLKTKKFAFKVHNSGTTFYFASERQEDMGKWMNKMGLAAISFESSTTSTTNSLKKLQVHSHQQDGGYSESDEDPEDSNGNKEGSLKSAFSSGSVHSPQSSPPDHKRQALTDQSCPMVPLDPPVSASLPSTSQCQEQATAYHAPSDGQTYQAKCEQDVSPQKEDEFQETLITLRRHDLTIDGVDQYKRRTHHLSSILGGNDGKKSVHVAQMRKLLALKRTLKTKEQELLDIDRLLASQPSSGRIQDFIGRHPQFK